ncbi:MAG: type 1 glutamine amidotransferase [Verrucomicrobiales bacterium]|jgi:type 1 glutamine amidotransferase
MKKNLITTIFPVTALIGVLAISFAEGKKGEPVKQVNIEKIDGALPKKAPAKPKQARKVLVFSKTAGFRHGSIETGVEAMKRMGVATGAFAVTATEDDSIFEPETLKEFDAIIMLNTTGELFKSKEEGREDRLKKSLVDFVKGGKGLVGMHSATDTYKNWKDYNDMMGGAFNGHPWHEKVRVKNLDPGHPINKAFGGKSFEVTDEIYQFREDTAKPEERRMLLGLSGEIEDTGKGKYGKDGLYPISWCDEYGEGRVFYCSLGHRDEIFWNPAVMKHYLAGIQFALGDLEADASPK